MNIKPKHISASHHVRFQYSFLLFHELYDQNPVANWDQWERQEESWFIHIDKKLEYVH